MDMMDKVPDSGPKIIFNEEVILPNSRLSNRNGRMAESVTDFKTSPMNEDNYLGLPTQKVKNKFDNISKSSFKIKTKDLGKSSLKMIPTI